MDNFTATYQLSILMFQDLCAITAETIPGLWLVTCIEQVDRDWLSIFPS